MYYSKTISKFLLLIIVLLMHGQYSVAQTARITDSVYRILATAKPDSAGIELYLKTGAEMEGIYPQLAADIYRKALNMSTELKLRRGVTKSMIYYSATMYLLGKNDSGFYYNKEALALSKQNGDTLYAGICLMNMAMVSQQTGENEQALEYLLEGCRLIEKSESENIQNIEMQMQATLQTVYNGRSEFDKSIQAGKETVLLARKLNSKSSEGLSLIHI